LCGLQHVEMCRPFVLILFFVGVSSVPAKSAADFDQVVSEWEGFKTAHEKTYADEAEDWRRLKVYLENKERVASHNKRAHQGYESYFLKMNQHGDLNHEEFANRFHGCYRSNLKQTVNDTESWTFSSSLGVGGVSAPLRAPIRASSFIYHRHHHEHPSHVMLPENLDWRKLGAVARVKDQGRCGSCYAFAATGALEGQQFRKTGHLVELSEQQIVDCSRRFGNLGCHGGAMENVYRYIEANGGIDSEDAYPYDGVVERCHYSWNEKSATETGFVFLPSDDEEALKHALATVGPIAVAIDASPPQLQFYSHGMFDPGSGGCAGQVNHAMLVVAYGVDEPSAHHEGPFWIIKNSWSRHWGNDGYVKVPRNVNMCGIALTPSFPLV
jgi:cathepsin L